ncbi:MAG: group III truncated hemoglobin [Ilumatobacteraceae bacterium]
MSDLDTRPAIHDLVVVFYREIVFDDLLGPLFEEVAETDWAVHIPRLINYWCRILLGEQTYTGPLLAAHRAVNCREAFRDEHFERWHRLWVTSIDERWAGPQADHAKAHATRILGLISRRLRNTDHHCPHDAPQRPQLERAYTSTEV